MFTSGRTKRGFAVLAFRDQHEIHCSIQKSSLANEDCIWLGCDDPDPRSLIPGQGWTKLQMPENYMVNTRMHLTRDQVAALLPVLQYFVDHGDLDVPQENRP